MFSGLTMYSAYSPCCQRLYKYHLACRDDCPIEVAVMCDNAVTVPTWTKQENTHAKSQAKHLISNLPPLSALPDFRHHAGKLDTHDCLARLRGQGVLALPLEQVHPVQAECLSSARRPLCNRTVSACAFYIVLDSLATAAERLLTLFGPY